MWPSLPLNQALNKLGYIYMHTQSIRKNTQCNTSDQMERLNISYRITKYYRQLTTSINISCYMWELAIFINIYMKSEI